MKEVDETTWRNRFITMQLTRIGGTVVVLIGLLVWYSDVIAPPSLVIGLPIALIGLVISFWGPKYLSRKWRREDGR
jgi:hypothetical protein